MVDEIAILSHPVRHRCVTDDKMASALSPHQHGDRDREGRCRWMRSGFGFSGSIYRGEGEGEREENGMDGQQFDSI